MKLEIANKNSININIKIPITVYNNIRSLEKTIKDFGWDRKGIQDPKDIKKIADYAHTLLMNEWRKNGY